MAYPLKGNLRIDQRLTNISLAYTNENYIWSRAVPTLRVPKTSGKVVQYANDQLRIPDGRRSNKDTQPHLVEWALGDDISYQIEYYDHDEFISHQDYNEYEQPLDAQADAVWTLTTFKQQRLEANLASIMNDATLLTNTSTPSTLWDDSTSDPLGDMEDAFMAVKRKIARRPNKVITNDEVISALKVHPQFQNRINGVQKTLSHSDVLDIIANHLGIPVSNIYVGSALRETAIENQTSSLGDVWADDFVCYYAPDTASRRSPSAIYHMMLSTNKKQEGVFRYDDPYKLGDYFRIAYNSQYKLLDADAAYLYDQVIT